MGDCRIRILISKDLLPSDLGKDGDDSSTDRCVSIVRMFSADTTVRETAEQVETLWRLLCSSSASIDLWDVTMHPPKNITRWPMDEFSEYSGPKSKTLQSAGFFPSGTWMALPKGVHPNQVSLKDYDDVQYNSQKLTATTTAADATGNVEFVDGSFGKSSAASSKQLLPSQVLHAVTKRFEKEDKQQSQETEDAKRTRQENQREQRRIQQERAQKLDERIQKLEANSKDKNKKVSDQVRKMLVKSRATGSKKLKMQDRIYFQCVLDRGETTDLTKEYRFFSPQDTFAKIVASFDTYPSKNAEVLTQAEGGEYRRFPVAMRIYEAIAYKYLSENSIDTLIIRWYQGDEATTVCVGDQDDMETAPANAAQATVKVILEVLDQDMTDADEQSSNGDCITIEDAELTGAIRAMVEANTKGKKTKKSSTAAQKVRNMQMKMKAKGDSKRIKKMEDRFFLEVILVGKDGSASSSYQYLGRVDPLDRLVEERDEWDFLVPSEDNVRFATIKDASMPLEAADKKGILKSFDRIVLRSRSS